MFPPANPKMGAMSRALATAQPDASAPAMPPDPTTPDTKAPGAAHPDDVQIITEAAAADPVIAAIARVLGIGQ